MSTALALAGLFELETAFAAAVVSGMLSLDALAGSDVPFDPRIQHLRGHGGQARVAQLCRELLAGSEIRESHRDCGRVQDPYSLRCQPQVMGACLDLMTQQAATLTAEANAVTDNPLIFPDTGEALSAAISTPSRWPSPPISWRLPAPRSARSPSGASRCSSIRR